MSAGEAGLEEVDVPQQPYASPEGVSKMPKAAVKARRYPPRVLADDRARAVVAALKQQASSLRDFHREVGRDGSFGVAAYAVRAENICVSWGW